MKKLLLLLTLATVSTYAADVTFEFADRVGNKLPANLKIIPLGEGLSTNLLLTRTPITVLGITNGSHKVSGLYGGTNSVEINDGKTVSRYFISVPDGTNSYNAADLVVTLQGAGGIYAYPTTVSDSKYATKADLAALPGATNSASKDDLTNAIETIGLYDTNRIVVSGAGNATVNGTYAFVGTNVWSKGGTNFICILDNVWSLTVNATTMGTTNRQYRSDTGPNTPWTISQAIYPAPSVQYYSTANSLLAKQASKASVIVYGSSAAYYYSATDQAHGWAGLLKTWGETNGVDVYNLSIPGDCTTNLIDRWPKDVAPLASRLLRNGPAYIIFASGVPNEPKSIGISTMDWADNAKFVNVCEAYYRGHVQLVNVAKDSGLRPIVFGPYPFNAQTNNFGQVLTLGSQMEALDAIVCNMTRTTCDGTGKLLSSFDSGDGVHVNNAGHLEMFNALPKSQILFGAERNVNVPPIWHVITCPSITVSNTHFKITCDPMSSFTTGAWLNQTNGDVNTAYFHLGSESGNVRIRGASGFLELVTSTSGLTSSVPAVGSGWHHFVVSYNKPTSNLTFYVDGKSIGTLSNSPWSCTNIWFGGTDLNTFVPQYVSWSQPFVYRTALGTNEVRRIYDGYYSPRGLEFLSDFAFSPNGSIANIAQTSAYGFSHAAATLQLLSAGRSLVYSGVFYRPNTNYPTRAEWAESNAVLQAAITTSAVPINTNELSNGDFIKWLDGQFVRTDAPTISGGITNGQTNVTLNSPTFEGIVNMPMLQSQSSGIVTVLGVNGDGEVIASGVNITNGALPAAPATLTNLTAVVSPDERFRVKDTTGKVLMDMDEFGNLQINPTGLTLAGEPNATAILGWNGSIALYNESGGPNTYLDPSGSGHFAKQNISWDMDGNLTVKSIAMGTNVIGVTNLPGYLNQWATNDPASFSGGSATFPTNVVTLAYTGETNVLVDFALGQKFTLTLTNNAYLIQPTNLTAMKDITISVVQDGTGQRTLGFDTNYWRFPSGQILTTTTNANSASVISCIVCPCATNVYTVQTLNFQ